MRLLKFFLLITALAGQIGQTAASATAAAELAISSSAAAAAMSEDCAEMMAQSDESKPNGSGFVPCSGTLKCMVAMGCVSLTLIPSGSSADGQPQFAAASAYWPKTPIFNGANLAPELHPPATLG